MKAKWEVKGWDHHPAIRVKKHNNVAERQLQNRISSFQQMCKEQTGKLEQNMRNLQRQLNHMDSEKERSWTESKKQERLPSGYIFRRLTATPEVEKRSRQLSFICDFGEKDSKNVTNKCRYFPCSAPNSYHTIGFRIDSENTDWISWKELRHSLSDSAMSAMGKSAILNTGVSRLRAERREELLKLEMERRRKRQERDKPPPWETNYGKPSPYKRLKYPVRLDPINI